MNIKKYLSGSLKLVVLTGVLAISANVVMASDIANSDNYKPGGKYRLFGGGRGTVTNLTNYIRVGGGFTQQVGNLAISTTTYSGGLSYEMQFHNHGWQVHSPFANTAQRDFSSKKGSVVQGGTTLTDLHVTGYEIHPADGYDGEQGGGYPTPTGARDEYLYTVNGKEVSVRVVNPDKLPPMTPINDNQLLREAGIDSERYEKSETGDERTKIERLTLVGENADGGLTGYNGGAENNSADINNGEVPLPQSENSYPCVDCCPTCGVDLSKYGGQLENVKWNPRDPTTVNAYQLRAIESGDPYHVADVLGISVTSAAILIANHQAQNGGSGSSAAGGAMPPDDNGDNDWKNDKKKQAEHKKTTNSEIKKEAEKLGYKQVKGETSHGELVFKKGNSYISFDRTSHSGGYWKEASSPSRLRLKNSRNGTFNKDLTKKVGD
ncbi:MAG: MafB family polymorphic toxin [Neisseriaceae bacterium]|nr:MafB family polymorphic toxin [Neisseriaceae bacterium]